MLVSSIEIRRVRREYLSKDWEVGGSIIILDSGNVSLKNIANLEIRYLKACFRCILLRYNLVVQDGGNSILITS
jgi:hypothetical protein